MSINCEVILRGDATPEQHRAVGAALWSWCIRNAGGAGICQYLDNQPLADLLAGRPPHAEPLEGDAGLPRVPFLAAGNPTHDRAAVLEGLRQALPGEGVADVRVSGVGPRER
jgi:hypothetical protein